MKKVVIVTGASSGFGFEIAKELAQKEYIVYAGARSVNKMEPLKALGVHVLALDVTNDDSVIKFCQTVMDEQGTIDILYNNAGYGTYGIVETQSLDSIKAMFEVNLFGVARMNQAVLPIMRKNRSGRIIHTASLVSHISLAGLGFYAASKHALRAMIESLRMEVKPFNIDIVQIEPGAVNTGFEDVAVGSIEKTDPDYELTLTQFTKFVKNSYKTGPSPKKTVNIMIKAATKKHPKWVYQTTPDAKIFPKLKAIIGLKWYSRVTRWLIFNAK